MRQTLLRLRPDQLWSFDNEGNTLLVGIGFLLVPWALFGLYWAVRSIPRRPAGELMASMAVWLGVGALILVLPTLSLGALAPRNVFIVHPESDLMKAGDEIDFRRNQKVRVSSDDTLPAGLSADTDYFVIDLDRRRGTFRLSTSTDGSPVDITGSGRGQHAIRPLGIPLYGYGFMLFVGFLAAAWNASRRARRVGLEGDLIWDLAMWLIFPGIIGARLFYLVQYHEKIFADKTPLESIGAAVNLADGGLVFFGSFLGGLAGFAAFSRLRRLRPLLLADVVVPAVFIGIAFGRIGCLLNGCCYGDASSLPWAVTFPEGSVPSMALANRGFLSPDAPATYPLHPTQLYSSLNALVLYALSAAVFRCRPREGAVVAVGLLAYPVTRFLIEFLRGDEPGRFATPLTISQWVSLAMLVVGFVYLLWLWKRPAGDRASATSVPAADGTS